ncbi:MAG: hypothetical protein V7752_19900 [Halopseudomonas sp.]
MKDFLKYFGSAFLLFGCIGLVTGWGDRLQRARQLLYAETVVVKCDDLCDQGRFVMRFECPDHYTYFHSIDNGQGWFAADIQGRDARLRYSQTVFEKPSSRHLEYAAFASAFLGAPASYINLRGVFEASKKEGFFSVNQLKKTVFGLLGAVSGHSAGRWLGARIGSGCESDIGLEALRDPKGWLMIETDRLYLNSFELVSLQDAKLNAVSGINMNRMADGPIKLCNTGLYQQLEAMKQFARLTGINPQSSHFETLERLAVEHRQIQASDAYAELNKMARVRQFPDQFANNPVWVERLGYSDARWNRLCQELEEAL